MMASRWEWSRGMVEKGFVFYGASNSKTKINGGRSEKKKTVKNIEKQVKRDKLELLR